MHLHCKELKTRFSLSWSSYISLFVGANKLVASFKQLNPKIGAHRLQYIFLLFVNNPGAALKCTCLQCEHRELWVKLSLSSGEQCKANIKTLQATDNFTPACSGCLSSSSPSSW